MQISESRRPTVVVTVDLGPANEGNPVLPSILDQLSEFRTPAAWLFARQGNPSTIARIFCGTVEHEFGILATPDWAGPRATRSQFAQGLAEAVARAAEAGILASVLGLHQIEPPADLDLLEKYQLQLIRARIDRRRGRGGKLAPRLARFGIWQSHASLVLPARSRWGLSWAIRRMLNRTIEQEQSLHVAVDARRLAGSPTAGLAMLRSVLSRTAARRELGQIDTVPFSSLLKIYAPRRPQFVSRSILRAA
jgi:hypothetical protein